MLREFRERYKGSTIAILGSGPSISLFNEKEDLAIAVNGAALMEKKYQIFLAGDVHSPQRDWWLASENNSNKKNEIIYEKAWKSCSRKDYHYQIES